MKGFFIYKFEDIEQNLLYVGLTTNLTRRINHQHLPLEYAGNLSVECIKEIHRIYFHECDSKSDMETKEKYLINSFKPKYCDKLNNGDKFSFSIPIKWKEYWFKTPKPRKEKANKNVKVFTLNLKETPYNKLINLFQEYKLKNEEYTLTLTQFIEKIILHYVDFLKENKSYSAAPEEFINKVILKPGRRPFREKNNEETIPSNIWLDEKIYKDFLNITFTHAVKFDAINIANYSLSFMTSVLIDFIESNKKYF